MLDSDKGTNEEKKNIGEKIRQTKLGGKNPNARKIRMINIINNEVKTFDSQQECADYLQLSSHMPISRRCRHEIISPLNNTYQFEYYNE